MHWDPSTTQEVQQWIKFFFHQCLLTLVPAFTYLNMLSRVVINQQYRKSLNILNTDMIQTVVTL